MTVDLRERVALCKDFTPEERDLILEGLTLVERWQQRHDKPVIIEKYAPPNYLGRIDAIYAALSLDEGGEGVCAAPLGNSGVTAALIAADKTRFDTYMRPMAQRLAKMFGKPVRIAKFTKRDDIEVLQP
ncbi:MAG: hypothetical protein J2P55_03750 [Rhizobiales bacterium]|nr:hypothetical protein [Hyphomicrobiales bacterium]